MTMSLGVALLLSLSHPISARNWMELVPSSVWNQADPEAVRYLMLTDHFLAGSVPPPSTAEPTWKPMTRIPTKVPTAAPTMAPTAPPTTPQPTPQPTASPTLPPTPEPIDSNEPYPRNPVPVDPMPWYFNYDISNRSVFGPGEMALIQDEFTFIVGVRNNRWGTVTNPPDFYWKEFTNDGWGTWKGILDRADVYRNRCADGSLQSPVDIRENTPCTDTHRIQSQPGNFRVTASVVQKEIHSNKLRLLYPRRPCADIGNSTCQPNPPYAVFPQDGFAETIHIDIKVPAEHRIWTETFDAEMQIFSIHRRRPILVAHSVLIRARDGAYNSHFQEALMSFQYTYDRNKAECAIRDRNTRQLHEALRQNLGIHSDTSGANWTSSPEFSTNLERPDYPSDAEDHDRDLQITRSWDPRDPELMPSENFYRYDGSLTEPPCGEFVKWFICDKPMLIDEHQLEQLKRLIFTHTDANCHKTSVHFQQSVARPIRPANGRPISKCISENFVAGP